MFLNFFDHLAWADSEALGALRAMPEGAPERAHATAVYAHVAAAQHIWLARLHSRPPVHPVWPALELDAAAVLAMESTAALRALAEASSPADLMRVVAYENSTGKQFRNTVADILAHIAMHGSYHRGQLALLTRQGGATPAGSDYIAYVRTQC